MKKKKVEIRFPLCFTGRRVRGGSTDSGQQPTPQSACHKRRVQNFAQLEGGPDAAPDSLLRGGRPGRGSSPGRGSGKSPPGPPLRTETPRGRLPEGPAGVWPPRPGGRLARRRERASARGRPAAAPSPTPKRKSHLPRRALEAPGGHGGAGRPGGRRREGGGRGPAGQGEGCSAPRAPPAPSRQPHPRRRPARSEPLRLRQAAPGQWGEKFLWQPRRGASESAGGGRGPARPSVRARRERLPAPPPPARPRPLQPDPAPSSLAPLPRETAAATRLAVSLAPGVVRADGLGPGRERRRGRGGE